MQLSEISLQRLKRKISHKKAASSGLEDEQRKGTAGGEKHILAETFTEGSRGPLEMGLGGKFKGRQPGIRAAGCFEQGTRFRRTLELLCCTVTTNHVTKGGEMSIYLVPPLCQAP